MFLSDDGSLGYRLIGGSASKQTRDASIAIFNRALRNKLYGQIFITDPNPKLLITLFHHSMAHIFNIDISARRKNHFLLCHKIWFLILSYARPRWFFTGYWVGATLNLLDCSSLSPYYPTTVDKMRSYRSTRSSTSSDLILDTGLIWFLIRMKHLMGRWGLQFLAKDIS